MGIAAATFVGVLAIVLGAYYLLVAREEEKVIERLKPATVKKSGLLRSVIKAEDRLSSVGAFQDALQRAPATDSLRLMVQQSGLSLNVGTLLLLMGCFGLGGYLIVNWLSRQLLIGVAVGLVSMWLPYWYVARARARRMLKFEETFPEAIDLVARALRAGHALPTGLAMVADEMPAPIGTEFRKLHDEQNFGLTLPDALRNFADRVPLIDARFFVTAVLTQRESGGNLSEVLDNLSSVIRARFKVKRQIRVISAHGRITGWVLALLPPSLAIVTMMINPDHLGTLTGDPLGRQMIAVGIFLQIVGTLIIRKIVDVEY
jgi:tight adherence protein B